MVKAVFRHNHNFFIVAKLFTVLFLTTRKYEMLTAENKILFNEKEASKYISLSVSFLQKSRNKMSSDIEEGRAPAFVKVKNRVLYRKDDLLNFANGLTRRGTKQYDVQDPWSNKCVVAKSTLATHNLRSYSKESENDLYTQLCG